MPEGERIRSRSLHQIGFKKENLDGRLIVHS